MAEKGDLIIVNPPRVGGPPREGEIIEVLEGDLRVHYRVRWSDGHESLFAPGAGAARIESARNRKGVGSRTTESTSSSKTSAASKASARTTTTKKSAAKKTMKPAARTSTARTVAAKKSTSRRPSGRR